MTLISKTLILILCIFLEQESKASSHICAEVIAKALSLSDKIRLVTDEKEISHLSNIAMKAFEKDPLFDYIEKTAEQKRKFIEGMIRHVFNRGKILVDKNDGKAPRSFALWIESESASAGPWDLYKSGQLHYALNIPISKLLKLLKLDAALLKSRKEFAGKGAMYLYLIGVDPDSQKQGLGRALIEPVIRAAKERDLPLVLEIQKKTNQAYYEQFGFKLVKSQKVPSDGPETSTMVYLP